MFSVNVGVVESIRAERRLLGAQLHESGDDRAIAELAARQDGLIAARQLRALGYGAKAIGYRVRTGRLHRLHRGVYVVGTSLMTPRGHLRAALLRCGPGALLSHRSAADTWGIRKSFQTRVEITVPGGSRHAREGIALRSVTNLDPRDFTALESMPVTSLPRTLLDLAAVVSSSQLTRALEQTDRLELLDVRAIREVCERYTYHAGKRALLVATEELRDPPPAGRISSVTSSSCSGAPASPSPASTRKSPATRSTSTGPPRA